MARSERIHRVAGKSYWRESDAMVVVDAWRGSGETLSGFCRHHRLKPKRVARWVRRLEREPMQFHPVAFVSNGSRSAEQPLELELSHGEIIRLPPGFVLEDLRRVLVALDERR